MKPIYQKLVSFFFGLGYNSRADFCIQKPTKQNIETKHQLPIKRDWRLFFLVMKFVKTSKKISGEGIYLVSGSKKQFIEKEIEMKNLESLVPQGHTFVIDEKHPFIISIDDLGHIKRIGELVYSLMKSTMDGLRGNSTSVKGVLFEGLGMEYQILMLEHPERYPVFIRIDLMIDVNGNWKIAEIDPVNKHGIGFALATRHESGEWERQKFLSLLAPYVTDDVTIVCSRKETFFRHEQRYFAGKLAEHTGKKVAVIQEEKVSKKLGEGLVLDFPFCDTEARELLTQRFSSRPESFINPPRHVLGGKALMSLPYEHPKWLEAAGMTEVNELKAYLPPTYLGPFVVKEVFSSGAKGIHFDATAGKRTVFQKYVDQCAFSLGGEKKYVRVACFFVRESLGELIVSANIELPVHGGNTAVHYHVNIE